MLRHTDLQLSLYSAFTSFPIISLGSVVFGHNFNELPRQCWMLRFSYPQIRRCLTSLLFLLDVLLYRCDKTHKQKNVVIEIPLLNHHPNNSIISSANWVNWRWWWWNFSLKTPGRRVFLSFLLLFFLIKFIGVNSPLPGRQLIYLNEYTCTKKNLGRG